MCGRTALSLNKEQMQCACSYKAKERDIYVKPDWLHEHNDGKEYFPSQNIAPTDVTPVLLSASKHKHAARTERVLKPMMWGIIPPWHTGDYKRHNLSTNNCRLENIKTSKLYSPILSNGGRCVIVVEGFYEWQTTNKSAKVKQPYYIYSLQDQKVKIDDHSTWTNTYNEDQGWTGINMLKMAGLYSVWQNNDTIVYGYSIITMESNSTLNWLHHRMPAILDTEEMVNAWLDIDNINADMALNILKPVHTLLWHPVSNAVNNSKNKNPNCNKRQQDIKKQKTLTAWFAKTDNKRKLPSETCNTVTNLAKVKKNM